MKYTKRTKTDETNDDRYNDTNTNRSGPLLLSEQCMAIAMQETNCYWISRGIPVAFVGRDNTDTYYDVVKMLCSYRSSLLKADDGKSMNIYCVNYDGTFAPALNIDDSYDAMLRIQDVTPLSDIGQHGVFIIKTLNDDIAAFLLSPTCRGLNIVLTCTIGRDIDVHALIAYYALPRMPAFHRSEIIDAAVQAFPLVAYKTILADGRQVYTLEEEVITHIAGKQEKTTLFAHTATPVQDDNNPKLIHLEHATHVVEPVSTQLHFIASRQCERLAALRKQLKA